MGRTGAKVAVLLLEESLDLLDEYISVNHSLIQSSVRSAMRRARLELGVLVLWVRSARGMAMSGLRLWTALMYSLLETAWKPVEVKTEMPWLVLPMGEATAGSLLEPRTVMMDEGMAVKLFRGLLTGEGVSKMGGERVRYC